MNKKQAEFYKIPSETSLDYEYTLIKDKNGWRCTCPYHVFHGHCKHIDKYIQDNKFVG